MKHFSLLGPLGYHLEKHEVDGVVEPTSLDGLASPDGLGHVGVVYR